MAFRHVALLQIQGKEFQLTPLPLRTVRPFVIEEVVLNEVADEVGLDLNDQMAITKFLKGKVSCSQSYLMWAKRLPFCQVNALIEQANQLWEERNAKAVEDGELELPRMLPLVRLKVPPFPLKSLGKLIYIAFIGGHNGRYRNLQSNPLRTRISGPHRQPSRSTRLPPVKAVC